MTDTPNQTDDAGQANANLEYMREKAEKADALAEENRLLKTNMAFQAAGIDTSEGTPGALVFTTFQPEEGQEITSEAVLEYAQRFGVTPQPTGGVPTEQQEPQVNPQTQAEAQFFGTTNQIGNASDASVGEGDPNVSALDTFDEYVKGGGTRESAAAAGMSEIFAGAQRGDDRVVYDQEKWRERNR